MTRAVGDQWLVDDGLAAGDRLIVEGLQKVQPGMPCRPGGAARARHAVAIDAAPASSGSRAGRQDLDRALIRRHVMAVTFLHRPADLRLGRCAIMMLIGASSITRCRSRNIPIIAPPAVAITASYPGRLGRRPSRAPVTQIIEQNMTALDGLLYMSTRPVTSAAHVSITLTFARAPIRTSRRCRCRTGCSRPCRCCRRSCSCRASRSARHQNFLLAVGFVSDDGSMTKRRYRRLDRHQRRRPGQPRRRCRRGAAVRRRSTPCASGWTRTNSILQRSRPATSSRAIQAQNAQMSVGQLGGLPAVPGPAAQRHVIGAGAAADARAVRRHRGRSNTDGSNCACGTWRGSSSARQTTASTAIQRPCRPRASRSSSPPAPTR